MHHIYRLIITETANHNSFSQIQTKNSPNSLKILQTFSHFFLRISWFFLVSLVLIIICRCYWGTVAGEIVKNLAKPQLSSPCSSMASWSFYIIKLCRAKLLLAFIFHNTIGHLFWQLEARKAQEHELHIHKVRFRILRFLKSACGLGRSWNIDYTAT